MHESGIARKIVDAACRIALADHVELSAITVELDDSCRDLEGLRVHTQAAAVGTVAEGIDVRLRHSSDLPEGAVRLVSVTVTDD